MNNWKYASLGERDRLKLIRDGNEDVYKTEKKQNSAIKKAWENVGLDTAKIDNWDKMIDDAFESSKKSAKNDLPKFMSTRASNATNELNRQMKQLKNQAFTEAEDAVEKAANDMEYIKEWLAGHGYSSLGSTAQKKKKEISDELSDVLDEISREFAKKSESARATYLAKLRSSV